jgi:predicted nuclease with TOPRIM domain|tara:strand:+ start:2071 stop:2394 length:324 start_codon:yes stop_codon:yes gene_type:complete
MSADNGWSEYSKLVLKELSSLATNIESLNNEIQELKQEIARMREREDRVEELRNWKDKIDEVVSPSQLQAAIKEIDTLKEFKTKSITIFMVVQFLMGTAIALLGFWE